MRIEGWEGRLHEHLKEARTAAFEWGRNDCALWSADWVRKATGQDLCQEWLGQYSTKEELLALLKDRGYASPSDIAAAHLPSVPVTHAQRGDIVLHPHETLGIADGTHAYFLMERGITRMETLRCLRAWRVG